jgi:hypothetical protein
VAPNNATSINSQFLPPLKKRVGGRVGRCLALLLETGEQRRFFELEPDIARQHDEDRRDQKRDAPAPVAEHGIAHRLPADQDDQ